MNERDDDLFVLDLFSSQMVYGFVWRLYDGCYGRAYIVVVNVMSQQPSLAHIASWLFFSLSPPPKRLEKDLD